MNITIEFDPTIAREFLRKIQPNIKNNHVQTFINERVNDLNPAAEDITRCSNTLAMHCKNVSSSKYKITICCPTSYVEKVLNVLAKYSGPIASMAEGAKNIAKFIMCSIDGMTSMLTNMKDDLNAVYPTADPKTCKFLEETYYGKLIVYCIDRFEASLYTIVGMTEDDDEEYIKMHADKKLKEIRDKIVKNELGDTKTYTQITQQITKFKMKKENENSVE